MGRGRGRGRGPVGIVAAVALAASGALLFAPAARAAPGDLDPSFSTDGIVEGVANADVVIQPDGRIITAGFQAVDGRKVWTVSRFLPDGTPDPNFSGDGEAITPFEGQPDAAATSIALGPDGAIVAGGWAGSGSAYCDPRSDDCDHSFAVARYTPNGSLDGSFSGDGTEVTDFGEAAEVRDLAVEDDGEIVVAGDAFHTEFHWVVARFESSGGLDQDFSGDGSTRSGFSEYIDVNAAALAVQPDGKVIVFGDALLQEGSCCHPPLPSILDLAIARYLPDGTPDPMFGGGDGEAATMNEGRYWNAADLVLFDDGKILAATTSAEVLRYDASGELDPTFSGDGIGVREDSGGVGGVAIDSENRIITVGSVDLGGRTESDLALVRFTSAGEPDPAFGTNGLVTKDVRGHANSGGAVAVQSNGTYVVAGNTAFGNTPWMAPDVSGALFRFLADDGPADADADGIGDAEDTCPRVFGPGASGCPGPHPRSIQAPTLTSSGFVGRLSSPAHGGCGRAQEVELFKVREGDDQLIGTETSVGVPNGQGLVSFGFQSPSGGEYYFHAPESAHPDVGTCAAAQSELTTILYQRTLTLEVSPRGMAGTLTARRQRCVKHQDVAIFKVRNRTLNQPDKLIANLRTDRQGRFQLDEGRRRGAYFATTSVVGDCAAAMSPVERPR